MSSRRFPCWPQCVQPCTGVWAQPEPVQQLFNGPCQLGLLGIPRAVRVHDDVSSQHQPPRLAG
eukprot:10664498-Lingulodinium_polyedra.AAC.1